MAAGLKAVKSNRLSQRARRDVGDKLISMIASDPHRNPWTLYWQANRLHSCIASRFPGDEEELTEYWVRFGGSLVHGSRLIDLATGNGAVPFALRHAGLDLDITAVDKADILPQRYLESAAETLRGVCFLGGVDLCDEPTLAGPYDALTSQFGIEYVPAQVRAGVIRNLLRTGGRFQLLVHHAHSAIVRPRQDDLEELTMLLEPGGLMTLVQDFSNRWASSRQLQTHAKQHATRSGRKSERISGQVLTAVQAMLNASGAGSAECYSMAADLHCRVSAEMVRLQQLMDAALDRGGAESLASDLESNRLSVEAMETLQVGVSTGKPALVGWHIAGQAS